MSLPLSLHSVPLVLTVCFFAETSDASIVKIQMEYDYIKFQLFFSSLFCQLNPIFIFIL